MSAVETDGRKRVVSVVGARPNFMKIAPLERELARFDAIRHITVHTGQHYDKDMSDVFFAQLGIRPPVLNLGVGSGGHGEMTGKVMIGFEKACFELKPDLVVVVGDVNSTIAASLVARKLFIPVAHVEAGLRSFDETMPEELNRRLTDCLSNLLFVSEPSGLENLEREGVPAERVHLVGDIMLDTLQTFLPQISQIKRWEGLSLDPGKYVLVTIHRPSNVDTPEALEEIIDIIEAIPLPALFPIHPRTVKRLEEFGLKDRLYGLDHVRIVAPQPYLDFLSLLEGAAAILSDSGSVQGESSFFDVPCLVCRENTERPFYLEHGASRLVGRNRALAIELLAEAQAGRFGKSTPLVRELGTDVAGKTARIIHRYLT